MHSVNYVNTFKINERMNKTERLFQMLEQPRRYTADEWQEILADDTCRDLYRLMSKTRSALDAARADEEVTDELIDAEWQRLAKPRPGIPAVYKIAAMFIGVLMLSGIAFATISIVSHRSEENVHRDDSSTMLQEDRTAQPSPAAPADTIPQFRIFKNVPFDEMITEIATYYNKVPDIQGGHAHELRLYYHWDRRDDIADIVDDLNHFDHVDLAVEGDRLTVKP